MRWPCRLLVNAVRRTVGSASTDLSHCIPWPASTHHLRHLCLREASSGLETNPMSPGRPHSPTANAGATWRTQEHSCSSMASSGPAGVPSSPLAVEPARAAENGEEVQAPRGETGFRRDCLVLSPNPQPKVPYDDPTVKFGTQFSNHMLSCQWKSGQGWGAPLITAVEPLKLHPASQVLHYGMSCFEGMKAYKGEDGRVRLFRPHLNMARFLRSCQRLNLPGFDPLELLECIKELVRVEQQWVPQRDGCSLYMRPFMMASSPFLGVGPASEALFLCLLSPAGPYFPQGLTPISLFVDTKNVRAFPGGVGHHKLAGNYAPTILPQTEAFGRGCSQVLYVLKDSKRDAPGSPGAEDEEEDGLVGESGAMNLFFVLRSKDGTGLELVTPPLDGLILPGVTRDSTLELVRQLGDIQVSERHITLRELKDAHRDGRLVEVFGTGTAVIVQPIDGLVLSDGRVMSIPVDKEACRYWSTMKPGLAHTLRDSPGEPLPLSLTGRVYRMILDIQYGYVQHPWSVVL